MALMDGPAARPMNGCNHELGLLIKAGHTRTVGCTSTSIGIGCGLWAVVAVLRVSWRTSRCIRIQVTLN